MTKRTASILGATLLASAAPALAEASADPRPVAIAADDAAPGDIVVTGVADPRSAAATGLNLTLSETPQSVTIVDQARIRTFQLNTANDLLEQVVGINVDRNETDRTAYNSRGFDINSFQFDGIGLGLNLGIQFGDLDTVLFERIEAVRGADAMLTGIGNPSATINFVRKRPTDTLHAYAAGQLGSHDLWRVEGDVGGPLDEAGTLTARLIGAHEQHDSWLRFNHVDRDVGAGLLAWSPADAIKLTVGYSRQQNNSDGNLWGAVPLLYSDGTRIDYPRSTTTAQPWTYWNSRRESAFAEAAVQLGGGWAARGVFTYNHIRERARLLYVSGTIDRATGAGLTGYAILYPSDQKQYLGDLYASGPFELFGRHHQLAFGLSTGRSHLTEDEADADGPFDVPPLAEWTADTVPLPDFPAIERQTSSTDRITRLYGAAHLDLADPLKAVVGASAVWLRSTGISYGTDQARKASRVSPYAGLILDLAGGVKLYGSYTDIFSPQIEVDIDNRKLAPARGTSIEAGLKGSWLGGRLYATAALFRSKQTGLASFAGSFPNGKDYSIGVDTTAKGIEFEVAGQIAPGWRVDGGVTFLSIKDDDGAATRRFVPRRTLKLSTSYTVPEWRNLTLGAQLRAQSRVQAEDDSGSGFAIRQGGYAELDLVAGIDIVDRVRLAVNVDNVTDARFLNSLEWGQAYYAAPRTVRATLSFAY